MALPNFTSDGILPEGIHLATKNEIIDLGASGRKQHKRIVDSLNYIFDFALSNGAKTIIFGGSLISQKKFIHDIDVILVFETKSDIPKINTAYIRSGLPIDLQYTSNDESKILSSFVKLFETNKDFNTTGLVRVDINEKNDFGSSLSEPTQEDVDLAKADYALRSTPHHHNEDGIEYIYPEKKGVLVTIHGIHSSAPWNALVSRYASSDGWVVAPYLYGYTTFLIFFSKRKRLSILEDFRQWLYHLSKEQNLPIDLIAHSFGTYVIIKYLNEFEEPPVKIRSLILTGAIINEDIDPGIFSKVSSTLHQIAPNDFWVRILGWVKWLTFDELFGVAGKKGFNHIPENVQEDKDVIFSHTNVITEDVIRGRWLSFLNLKGHFKG